MKVKPKIFKIIILLLAFLLVVGLAYFFINKYFNKESNVINITSPESQNNFDNKEEIDNTKPLENQNNFDSKQTTKKFPILFSTETLPPLPEYCLQEGESIQIESEVKDTCYIDTLVTMIPMNNHYVSKITEVCTGKKPDDGLYLIYSNDYVSILKDGKEIRRFSLDKSSDLHKFRGLLTTPCYLFADVELVSLSENKLVLREDAGLHRYNYNGDYQIVSKSHTSHLKTSPSGRYIAYGDIDSDDKNKIGIFDSQKNIVHETFLSNEILEIDLSGIYFIWSKNEEKVWIQFENIVGGIEGFASVDLNNFLNSTYYDFSDTKWSRVFAFNPDTGWFVAENGGTASSCFSEGMWDPDSFWNKYFVNIYTGEKQFIESSSGCPVVGEFLYKWIDDKTYQEDLMDGGEVKTFILKK